MALIHELIRSVPFIVGSLALLAVYAFAFIWDRRNRRRKQHDEANPAALVSMIAASTPPQK